MPPGWLEMRCEWKRPIEWQSNVGLHSAESSCAERAAHLGDGAPNTPLVGRVAHPPGKQKKLTFI
jgi:hypothetical protein